MKNNGEEQFFGYFRVTMLEGNRIRLPNRIIEQIVGKQMWLSKIPHKMALAMYPEGKRDEVVEGLKQYIKSDDDARIFLSTLRLVSWDRQGRMYLSAPLANHLQLHNDAVDVVVLGVGNHIEVWNSRAYSKLEDDYANGNGDKEPSG